MKKRVMKVVVSLVLMCAVLSGLIPQTVQAAKDQSQRTEPGPQDCSVFGDFDLQRFKATGGKDFYTAPGQYIVPLYVLEGRSLTPYYGRGILPVDIGIISYCFNGRQRWPLFKDRDGDRYRKIDDATNADMKAWCKDPENRENLKGDILKVCYNGYPFDKANLTGRYNLSDVELRAVTQAAIWYFTDRLPLENEENCAKNELLNPENKSKLMRRQGDPEFQWKDRMTEVYNMFISNDQTLVVPPPGFVMDLYISAENFAHPEDIKLDQIENKSQNVLSTRLTQDFRTNNETVEVKVGKRWGSTPQGDIPESITVNLLADGVVYKTETLRGDTNWEHTFAYLPRKVDGNDSRDIVYTIEEVSVQGFKTESISGNAQDGFVITNEKINYPVKVSKQDLSGKEIGGASIEVYKAERGMKTGQALAQWTSEEGKTKELQLAWGDYILAETAAPQGYEKLTTEVKFSISEAGDVSVEEVKENGVVLASYDGTKIVIKNRPATEKEYPVKVSKQDLSGKEIGGASIEVYKAERGMKTGQALAQWTSEEGKTKELQLAWGDYILAETAAPQGYEKLTTEVKFSISEAGDVSVEEVKENGVVLASYDGTKIVIKNRPATTTTEKEYPVKVSKQDLSGKEIGGASIEVYKAVRGMKTGQALAQWTSEEGKTKELQLVKGDYILAETAAPQGYEKLTTEVKFSISEAGDVSVEEVKENGVVLASYDGTKIVIKNRPATTTTEKEYPVKVSKQDLSGKEIGGASIEVYKAVRGMKTGQALAQWTSEEGKTKELQLVKGDYILAETAAPQGYEKLTTEVKFSISEAGDVSVEEVKENGVVLASYDGTKIVIKNRPAAEKEYPVKVSKQDLSGKEIGGASIEVYKAERGMKTGQALAQWTSEEGKTKELQLVKGDYILAEAAAPQGYEKLTTEVKFSISEAGDVSVEEVKENGVVLASYDGTKIVIKNRPAGKTTTQDQEKSSPKVTSTSQSEKKPTAKSVQTGDSSPISLYMLVMMLAGGVCAFVRKAQKK